MASGLPDLPFAQVAGGPTCRLPACPPAALPARLNHLRPPTGLSVCLSSAPSGCLPADPEGDSAEQRSLITSRPWNVLVQRTAAALAAHQQRRAQQAALGGVQAAAGLDAEGMLSLLSSRDVCVGEYELLRLCAAWCR